LGEFSVKRLIISNEFCTILITAISWPRIQCYLQNAGGFINQSAAISFSSRGLLDGANSGINEQKELICFDIIFFHGLVLKCSYTHDF
jgi:hypothetical protein